MTKKRIILAGLIFPLLFSAMGCKNSDQGRTGQGAFPPPAVEIHTVKTRVHSPVSILPGRVAPVREAQIRARVAGIILSRHFEEGREVKKGDLLFKIDPAPFEAELARAEAGLAAAEASLFDARTIAERHETLIKTGAVSTQQWDSAQARFKSALANQRKALAELRTAKLNLGYATVRAPISGRIGRAMVTEGALVGQGEVTLLATIRQQNPIYVDFTQPVPQYLKIRAAFESSKAVDNGDAPSAEPARVSLLLEDIGMTLEGKFLFSDVLVNTQTGQVSLRARFPNERGWLLPGMFVRVKTTLAEDTHAAFIPQRAVIRNSDGKASVVVVDETNTASMRSVELGEMEKGDWRILKGLAPGERIVATGAQKVRPGMILDSPEGEQG